MPLTDRQPVATLRPARWEAAHPEAVAAFVDLMDLARTGLSLSNLQLDPVHLRVIARLVAIHHDVPGLTSALATQYDRTVQHYVRDRETQRFLLGVAGAADAKTLVPGLTAVLSAAEALCAPLVNDPTFGWLYPEDRYCLVLSELGARLMKSARTA
jgi:hypothetical protein